MNAARSVYTLMCRADLLNNINALVGHMQASSVLVSQPLNTNQEMKIRDYGDITWLSITRPSYQTDRLECCLLSLWKCILDWH